jgi:hypothetical protein
VSKKKQQKNTVKSNKPEEGLTVSQSQQLDNTFERASTLRREETSCRPDDSIRFIT